MRGGLGLDTNLLLYALNAAASEHPAAVTFLKSQMDSTDVFLSELVLVELYVLLRNPAVLRTPLSAQEAVEVIDRYRRHPRWRIVDHPTGVMDAVWTQAAEPTFALRRIFDLRLAIGLQRHGVTRFATRNVSDFQALGFAQVFDPLDMRK